MCLIMQKDRSQSFTQSEINLALAGTFSKFFHPNPAEISYLCLASKKIQKNMFQKKLIQVGTIQTTIIHHSKHVYNQSNPSGTPLKTFQAHIPRVDFQQFWHFAFNSQTPLPKVIPSVPERSFPNPKHRLGSSKTLLPIDNVSNNLTYSHCASLSSPSSSLSS